MYVDKGKNKFKLKIKHKLKSFNRILFSSSRCVVNYVNCNKKLIKYVKHLKLII